MCVKGVSLNDLVCLNLEDEKIKEEVNFAFDTAKAKSQGNRTYNRFRDRTSLEKFMHLFPGDLAKNLFRMTVNNTFCIELIDYDEIREDNFEDHDLFDLKYETENIQIEIEVKSSVEKYSMNKQNLIDNRRIIIFNEQGMKDIVVQVLFIPKDEKCLEFAYDYGRINSGDEPITLEEFKEKYQINNEIDFAKNFTKCMEACIMGFITKEIAKEINESMLFQPKGETRRKYLNIYIKDSFPFRCLKKQLEEFTNSAN